MTRSILLMFGGICIVMGLFFMILDSSGSGGGVIVFIGVVLLIIAAIIKWSNEQKHEEYVDSLQEQFKAHPKVLVDNIYWGHYENVWINGDPGYWETQFLAGPDTFGGYDIKIKWYNGTGKTIKYCTFTVIALNTVNDPVFCQMRLRNKFELQVTGPIYEDGREENLHYFEDFIYTPLQIRPKIVSASVVYMDGTTEEFPNPTNF